MLHLGKWQVFLRPNAGQAPASRVIPTFLVLLVFASWYSLAFVYDGLRRRSSVQAAVACALNVGLVVYSAIQSGKIHTSITSISGSCDALGQPLVDLSLNMWADVNTVLIIVPCIVGAFTLLMAGLAWEIHKELEWDVYRAIAVPAIIAVLVLSHVWTAREIKPGTVFTIATHLAALGYLIYKIVIMYTWREFYFMYEEG
ncbi:hypothetical protein JHW43_003364 [Diplocarpon mali]|nr:hypothetical protein JHW43_003364 [Diplocarpon mali]